MLNFAPQEIRERARSYACLIRYSNDTLLMPNKPKQNMQETDDKKQVISDKTDKTSDSGQHKADKQKNEKIIVEV